MSIQEHLPLATKPHIKTDKGSAYDKARLVLRSRVCTSMKEGMYCWLPDLHSLLEALRVPSEPCTITTSARALMY